MTTSTSTRPTAIVVGAGFGGIALAIRLQAMGFQTTLLDNRDKPGGRAYVYEKGGFKSVSYTHLTLPTTPYV